MSLIKHIFPFIILESIFFGVAPYWNVLVEQFSLLVTYCVQMVLGKNWMWKKSVRSFNKSFQIVIAQVSLYFFFFVLWNCGVFLQNKITSVSHVKSVANQWVAIYPVQSLQLTVQTCIDTFTAYSVGISCSQWPNNFLQNTHLYYLFSQISVIVIVYCHSVICGIVEETKSLTVFTYLQQIVVFFEILWT